MRGRRNPQASMFVFVDLDERVPPCHPLRTIKRFADCALTQLSPTQDTMLRHQRPAIDPPARAAAESKLADQFVLRPQRTRVCEDSNCCGGGSCARVSWSQALTSPPSARTVAICYHVVAQQFFDEVVRQADALDLFSDED